jgi:hypothetical protein
MARQHYLSWMPLLSAFNILLCLLSSTNAQVPIQNSLSENEGLQNTLFSSSDVFTVLGSTKFPRPIDMLTGKNASIVLEPAFGIHRPDQDAVMAYAEGYELIHYLAFIESLKGTGFRGDIVLAVSALPLLREGVEEYLRGCDTCVIYAIDFTCSDDGFQTMSSRTQDNGGRMSFQMCKLDYIYGVPHPLSRKLEPVLDPREGRVVATSRYELYWIWTVRYHSHSWIMLLDARDAYFQLNPFQDLPRTSSTQKVKDGLLYFFGENTNQTRLGKSPKNRKWLERAYSLGVVSYLAEKPTICSGSTMGEQIALEVYLRAMVNEWDETHTLQKGADQGFHNYLYYSNKLANAPEIRSIYVFDQGKGIINNLGALRGLKLVDLGLYDLDTHYVYNWDGRLSPVVHQWDRDKVLYGYTTDYRFPATEISWKEKKSNKPLSFF